MKVDLNAAGVGSATGVGSAAGAAGAARAAGATFATNVVQLVLSCRPCSVPNKLVSCMAA